MSGLNTELLERIAEHIEAFPDNFDMACWETRRGCGTVCCIAGWATQFGLGRSIVDAHDEDMVSTASILEARNVLGLPDDSLFGAGHWPQGYWVQYCDAKDTQEQAMIAAQLLRDIAKRGYTEVFAEK